MLFVLLYVSNVDAGGHRAQLTPSPAVHVATREKQQSHCVWTSAHYSHTPSKKKKKKTEKGGKQNKQTNKNMLTMSLGAVLQLTYSEANYKNCQYHFPLNSHNKKQPLLIWGKKNMLP